MDSISDDALIDAARAVLSPHTAGGYGPGTGRRMGHVGSALASSAGNIYSGVCIDTGSGTGFCAEHAAIAAMVTAREYRIAKIVAVYRDEQGVLFVLPPCGRCRLFISQIDPANLDARVVLSRTSSPALRELLPCTEWPEPLR
jgi:cytidine deaminase